jgi:hypothetical protein
MKTGRVHFAVSRSDRHTFYGPFHRLSQEHPQDRSRYTQHRFSMCNTKVFLASKIDLMAMTHVQSRFSSFSSHSSSVLNTVSFRHSLSSEPPISTGSSGLNQRYSTRGTRTSGVLRRHVRCTLKKKKYIYIYIYNKPHHLIHRSEPQLMIDKIFNHTILFG